MFKGDYFGEKALLKDDTRAATITALAPGAECLTLDRKPFIELLGNLEELQSGTKPASENRVSEVKEKVSGMHAVPNLFFFSCCSVLIRFFFLQNTNTLK